MARRTPRRRLHWLAYLWPGLPHLWLRGSLAGLTLALAFSVLLNILVLATWVWPAWLESRLKFACALIAGGLWIAALWETRGELRRMAAEREAADETEPNPKESPGDERLRAAQHAYLRGEWRDAERLVRSAIRADRDDFAARFWLVPVLRRSGKPVQALRWLERVERRDAADGWRTEIADERTLLRSMIERRDETPRSDETSQAA